MKLPFLSVLLFAGVAQATMLVEVDRSTQTIKVKTPRGDWEAKVSTGGGLKQPNGVERLDKTPYCANDETPEMNQVYIKAAESGPGRTMEKVHYSNAFSDQQGNKIPMPWAINLVGGIYFHEAPPAYVDLLGKNVSGGCIRLPPGRAEQFYKEMLEFGGITVTISGENPESKPGDRSFCSKAMVEKAKYELARKQYEEQRELRPEETSSFFDALFGGGSGSSGASKDKSKKKKKPADDAWATHPLGQY